MTRTPPGSGPVLLFALLALALLVLSGCASTTPLLRLDPVVQLAPPVAVPSIDPLVLNAIPWTVYNRAGLEALVAKLKAQGDTGSVIFVLDADGMQNLKLNFVELQRYLSQQKTVIVLLSKVVNQQAGVVDLPASPKP
jgi:hypothetical protein